MGRGYPGRILANILGLLILGGSIFSAVLASQPAEPPAESPDVLPPFISPAPAPAPPPAPTPKEAGLVFSDDFKDGIADGWNLETGWHIEREDDNYVLNGFGHRWARPKVNGWADYEITAKFKLIAEDFHLNFREMTEYQHIRYFLRIGRDGLSLSKQIKDSFLHSGHIPADLELGEWYRVKIALSGPNIKVYLSQGNDPEPTILDSEPILARNELFVSALDEGSIFTAGSTGIYRFSIAGGAYQNCPPEAAPDHPDSWGWQTQILFYKNRSIQWEGESKSPEHPNPINWDYSAGNILRQPTYEQAEEADKFKSIDIPLKENEYVTLVAYDSKGCFHDNSKGVYFYVEGPLISDEELKIDYTDKHEPILFGGFSFESLPGSRVYLDAITVNMIPPPEESPIGMVNQWKRYVKRGVWPGNNIPSPDDFGVYDGVVGDGLTLISSFGEDEVFGFRTWVYVSEPTSIPIGIKGDDNIGLYVNGNFVAGRSRAAGEPPSYGMMNLDSGWNVLEALVYNGPLYCELSFDKKISDFVEKMYSEGPR